MGGKKKKRNSPSAGASADTINHGGVFSAVSTLFYFPPFSSASDSFTQFQVLLAHPTPSPPLSTRAAGSAGGRQPRRLRGGGGGSSPGSWQSPAGRRQPPTPLNFCRSAGRSNTLPARLSQGLSGVSGGGGGGSVEQAAAGRRSRAPSAPGPAPSPGSQGLSAASTPGRCAQLARGQGQRPRARLRESRLPGAGLLQVLRLGSLPPNEGKLRARLGHSYLARTPPHPTPNTRAPLPIPGCFLS